MGMEEDEGNERHFDRDAVAVEPRLGVSEQAGNALLGQKNYILRHPATDDD